MSVENIRVDNSDNDSDSDPNKPVFQEDVDIYEKDIYFDPLSSISKSLVINSIKAGDCALDLVGIVSSISEVTRVEKLGDVFFVMNFTLTFQDDIKLPISIWDEDIDRIKPHIKMNHILHLDSPYAREQLPSKFTNGKNYMLTVRSNTVVNVFGKHEKDNSSELDVTSLKTFNNLSCCMNETTDYDTPIVLETFIKNVFREDAKNPIRKVGVISDGETKMIAYIVKGYDDVNFEIGQKISIIGRLQLDEINSNGQYAIIIDDASYIKEMDGKMDESILDNVYQSPVKRKLSDNSDIEMKKLKV